MKTINRFRRFGICFLSAIVFLAPSLLLGGTGTAIESGQYFSDYVYYYLTNDSFVASDYMFYADVADTVLVRVANESEYYDAAPQCYVYWPSDGTGTQLLDAATNSLFCNDLTLTNLASNGWYRIRVTQFTNSAHWYSHSFSLSFLRLPNAPLSYADTDVGTIRSGESLDGTISVGADLDAAMFSVSNRCTVQIRMGQEEVILVPEIKVFSPSGASVTNAFPTDYRAEVTCSLASTGIYTVVCNDKFNASGAYAISMVQIPGTHTNGSDLDLGTIISGETLTGTLDKPGDLDVATFTAYQGDVVILSMEEVDPDVNPVMELYDPTGTRLAKATDALQVCAVISNAISSNGLYTVICKDAEDRYDVQYSLTLERPGGSSTSNLPAVPTGISATEGKYEDHIVVTWSSASGANGYDVWRSHGTNAEAQLCTNNTTTSYEDYSVASGVIYYYKVRSRNDYGVSELSASDSGYCGATVFSYTRRALLVGIDHYSPSYGASDLTACTNDANSMKETMLLGDPSNRWASTNIQMVTDVQATKTTIRSALNTLASSSSAGDVVLYYQSSHGGQTDPAVNPSNTFICAYDASYTDAELASDLTAFLSDVTVIVIVDACFSGGLFKNAEGVWEWPFAERVMTEYRKFKEAELKRKGLAIPKDLGNNIAFMTACDYDEYSWESGSHGIYTGYLLEGCTLSSVDTNSDGEYQFLELHDYAAVNAAAATEGTGYQQHAQTYHSSLLQSTVARAFGTNVASIVAGVDNDYDGDGTSDLAVYHEDTGLWFISSLEEGVIGWGLAWGGPGFVPLTGDYDGDRTADLAVYNEDTGQWYIWSLTKGLIAWAATWGGPGLTPVAGDYSGDDKADLALYDKAAGYWYAVTLNGTAVVVGRSWAGTGFTPVPGDYDGDDIADYAMYHNGMGYWYVVSPSGASIIWGLYWGGTGYTAVSGDYDGDSIFDMAMYYSYTGQWFIWSQAQSAIIAWGTSWGGSDYTPVQGDYDGDGVWDLAVYNEDTGYWFIESADGTESIALGVTFGGPGFVPVQPTW